MEPETSSHLRAAEGFYDHGARAPQLGACCPQRNELELPDLWSHHLSCTSGPDFDLHDAVGGQVRTTGR